MNPRAFSLIELIVVAVIMAILSILTTPTFVNMNKHAYEMDMINKLKAIYSSQQMYFMNHNAYMQAGDDLNVCALMVDADNGIQDCIRNYGGRITFNLVKTKMGGASYSCVGSVCRAVGATTVRVTLNTNLKTSSKPQGCSLGFNPCVEGI